MLAVVDAWVREPRPGASVNAGYMTLVNTGGDAVELVGIESEAFSSIDLHEMASVDGLMEMREVPELPIAAGGHVQLAPGGMHLMMRGPRHELVAGEEVELTLVFASGTKQAFRAPVSTR